MTKWYVNTGRLACVIARNTAREAAVDAIKRDISSGGNMDDYGDVTEVNQSGQNFNPQEGKMFSTPALLQSMGVI